LKIIIYNIPKENSGFVRIKIKCSNQQSTRKGKNKPRLLAKKKKNLNNKIKKNPNKKK